MARLTPVAAAQPTGAPARERPSASRRGYGAAWQRLRKSFLFDNPDCVRCGAAATQVDHILPKAQGGTDDIYNLQALCHSCHSRKTVTEDGGMGRGREGGQRNRGANRYRKTYGQFAARERAPFNRGGQRLIHIVGGVATGKSWLRRELGQGLGIPTYSIDDERARLMGDSVWLDDERELAAWVALEDAIDAEYTCIVETSGSNANADVMLAERDVFVILCVASDVTRRERLQSRVNCGHQLASLDPRYVERMMRIGTPAISPSIVWESDGDNKNLDQVLSAINEWGGL